MPAGSVLPDRLEGVRSLSKPGPIIVANAWRLLADPLEASAPSAP